MARTTVEILGGQLDGTVLNNMASEATLREIVTAMKGISKSTDDSASGSGAAASPAARKRKAKSRLLSQAADHLGEQIGNTIGAIGTMSSLIATGNTKLSSYTRTLNDQVISKLPIFGGLLGGVGGLLTDSIEVLEDWNESLRRGTGVGATFGNSIIRASQAATNAAMGLDEFMRLVSSNAPAMMNLGNSVSDGAYRFSQISRRLLRNGGIANNSLRQMGMSVDAVNEALLSFVDQAGLGTKDRSIDELAESFENYQLGLMRISMLTGKTSKQIEDQMAIASKDTVYRLKMAKLLPAEQAKMLSGLTDITARYGEVGADLYKSMFLGLPSQNEDTQNLMVLMPHLVKDISNIQRTAQDRNVKADRFSELSDDVMISSILKSAKNVTNIQDFLAAASVGAADAQALRKSIDPILEQLVRYGDVSKLDEKQLRAMYQRARQEQKQRNDLTKFLNDFEIAMKDLKFNMMEMLYPVLIEIGEMAKKYNLPEKIKDLGIALTETVKEWLPKVITFFKFLGDENGRKFILNELSYFFERTSLHFNYYVKEFFRPGKSEEYKRELTKALKDAADRHEKTQKGIVTPERYTGQSVDRSDTGAVSTGTTAGPDVVDISGRGFASSGNRKGSPLGTMFHHTGGSSLEGALQTLLQKGYSYNYIIDKDGKIYQLLPSGRIAHHAGATQAFKGLKIDNASTIGVSLVAPGDQAVNSDQLKSALSLQKQLSEKYGFSLDSAFGHGQAAPGRKQAAEGMAAVNFIKAQTMASHSAGTLGKYGQMFRNFGTGEAVTLDNTEAVMTPEQMDNVMKTAGAINVSDMLASLDRNFDRLISLEREKNTIISAQLRHQESLMNNLAT